MPSALRGSMLARCPRCCGAVKGAAGAWNLSGDARAVLARAGPVQTAAPRRRAGGRCWCYTSIFHRRCGLAPAETPAGYGSHPILSDPKTLPAMPQRSELYIWDLIDHHGHGGQNHLSHRLWVSQQTHRSPPPPPPPSILRHPRPHLHRASSVERRHSTLCLISPTQTWPSSYRQLSQLDRQMDIEQPNLP